MKINPFLLVIALGIAALGAFGFYAGNSGETYRLLFTIGSGLSLFVTLAGLLALSSPNGGTVNIKITSALFFTALLVEHLVFSFTGAALAPYVVVTGVLLLVFALIVYALTRALK
jgi:hypothetical protein